MLQALCLGDILDQRTTSTRYDCELRDATASRTPPELERKTVIVATVRRCFAFRARVPPTYMGYEVLSPALACVCLMGLHRFKTSSAATTFRRPQTKSRG